MSHRNAYTSMQMQIWKGIYGSIAANDTKIYDQLNETQQIHNTEYDPAIKKNEVDQ